MPISQPWSRVSSPVAIPAPLSVPALAALDDDELAALVRDHLIPRQTTPAGRKAWGQLWSLLADESLVDDVLGVLDVFLDQVEDAMASPDVTDPQFKRMRKFQRLCEEAGTRLDVIVDQPLGWAGRRARKFNPPARLVIEELVDAIAEHRRTRTSQGEGDVIDESLWQVLERVELDPDQRRQW